MDEPLLELPPEINFSSFDFTKLTNSLLPDDIKSKSVGEKYLVFFLGEEYYAVATRQVAEAAPSLQTTPLPNSPEWLVGIANLRNEIVSVVNLPTLLKKSNFNVSPKSKLVILRSFEPDSAAAYVAFRADRLSEIISLRTEEIESVENEKSPYICGKAVHLSKNLHLIDAEKILASLII